MAEARTAPDTAPVVLWQTGGPGCSSLLAAFTENGPCLVPETGPNAGTAVLNPHAWNTNATMICACLRFERPGRTLAPGC